MKIMFVYSFVDAQSTLKPLRTWASIQFGISYISSVLKAHNHQTRLLVLGSNRQKDSIQLLKSSVQEFKPSLICFTAVFSQFIFIKEIAEFIKSQFPDIFLIIGGVHATLYPNDVINGPFDALCIGEGEYATLELCNQLEKGRHTPHNIENLWIKSHDGKIEKNKPRDFIQNLDMLPLPDREMWEPWMKEQIDGEFSVLLGRGCPYNCTYCSNHILRKIARGKYIRMRSPGNIINELALMHINYPHPKIIFEVEAIALDKTWAIEFCSQLEAFNSTIDNSILFACNFRISPELIDEKLFIAFKKANFYKINIGLESGSERIRNEVLKRNYSNDDFIGTVALARKYGLEIYTYNMIGIPEESLNDHMETVYLNRKCQPDGHYTSIFFPYPGTKLYDTCIKQGLIEKSIVAPQMERRQAIIKLPNFTKKQIQHAYTWFNYHVYKGYKPLWRILIHVITVKIQSNPISNFLFREIVQWPILKHLRTRLSEN